MSVDYNCVLYKRANFSYWMKKKKKERDEADDETDQSHGWNLSHQTTREKKHFIRYLAGCRVWSVSVFTVLSYHSILGRDANTCPRCTCFSKEIFWGWVDLGPAGPKKIPTKCEIKMGTFWLANKCTNHDPNKLF